VQLQQQQPQHQQHQQQQLPQPQLHMQQQRSRLAGLELSADSFTFGALADDPDVRRALLGLRFAWAWGLDGAAHTFSV
jgi:hypothetical protein